MIKGKVGELVVTWGGSDEIWQLYWNCCSWGSFLHLLLVIWVVFFTMGGQFYSCILCRGRNCSCCCRYSHQWGPPSSN